MSKRQHDPDDSDAPEPPAECFSPEEVIERERAERAAEVIDKWWYRDREEQGVLLRYRLEADDCDVILQTVPQLDQWVTGWPAKRKAPLYRVYEGRGKSPVFVVQGEYAVESAIAMGLAAVTPAGGADDVEHSDWRPLAGQSVVILPTNCDDGRHFARAVAGRVIGLDPAPQVRMLALPGLEEGEDIGSFGWDLKLSPQALGERVRELALRSPVMKPADLMGGPVYGRASRVAPAAVRWLWPGRVPVGKPTVIIGGCEPGKSIIALDLAARVSTGAEWPDGRGRAPGGNVILMTWGDDLRDTVRPRLDRAGADPERIILLDTVTRIIGNKEVRRDITLRDLADLERAIELVGNVKLLVIDPFSAYFDMPWRRGIGDTITALRRMASRHGLAVIITAELGGRDGLGHAATMALMSAVRSAWMLGPVPGPVETLAPGEIEAGLMKMPPNSAVFSNGAEEGLVAPDGTLSPSPGTPVEGRGGRGGGLPTVEREDPHPNPPPEYRERGQERNGTEVKRPPAFSSAQAEAPEPERRRFLLMPLRSVGGDPGGGLACQITHDGVEWEPDPIIADDRLLPHALRLPGLGLPVLCLPNGPALSLSNGPALSLSNGPALSLSNGRTGRKPESRDAAAQWLRRQLADGPVLVGSSGADAGTLQAAAKSAGMAWATVRRAFGELRGVKERCPRTGKYAWRLPTPAADCGGATDCPELENEE